METIIDMVANLNSFDGFVLGLVIGSMICAFLEFIKSFIP